MCNKYDPACVVGSKVASAFSSAADATVDKILSGLASALTDGVATVVTFTSTWWVDIPSNVACDGADLSTVDRDYGNPGKTALPSCGDLNAIAAIRNYVYPLVVAVLVGGMLVQGIRLAVQRRGDPMIRVGAGLAKFAIASAVSLGLLVSAQRAGDAFSSWVLGASTGHDFADQMITTLSPAAIGSPIAQILFSVVALLASLVQAVLMLFREGALAVLSGLVLLAAAGSMTESTQGWWGRVTGWMTALLLYKPAAALVYAAGFTLIKTSRGPQTAFVGITIYVLAILALPVLLRLTNWTAGEVAAGGGGQLLTSAGYALQAALSARGRSGGEPGGGLTANDWARHMDRQTPAGGPGGSQPTGPIPTPTLTPGGATGASAAAGSGAAGRAAAAGGPAGAAAAAVTTTAQRVNAAAQSAAETMGTPPTGAPSPPPPRPAPPRRPDPPPAGGGR